MILILRSDVVPEDVDEVVRRVRDEGLEAHVSHGEDRITVGVVGEDVERAFALAALPQVEEVVPVQHPWKLASRDFRREDSVVRVGDALIGGARVTLMAGPCAVESEEQLMTTAEVVARAGGTVLRGGAFKPRTSPYSFQGLGQEGLRLLDQARRRYGLAIVTEAMDEAGLEMVAEVADMVQIGARNMQNFSLLRRAGRARKPVLLKRGMSATLEELLMAAEYVMSEGNSNVILCERGVRTFSDHTRNTLDLSIVPAVHRLSHLPIMVDPSHGTGVRRKVRPLSRAAVAVGADGLLIEMHPDPDHALSDGMQSLNPDEFDALMREVRQIASVLDRTLN